MQRPNFQNPLSFIKRYFEDKDLLETYVNWGITAATWAIVLINKVLKHLITVQGIDPNTEPGLRQRMLFQQAVNEAFGKLDTKSYDDDFDFSWFNKQFKQIESNLGELNLNKEDFMKMTDVGNLKATQPLDVSHLEPVDLMTPEARQQYRQILVNTSSVPLAIDPTPIEELVELLDVHPVNQIAPEPVEQEREKERKETPEIHEQRIIEKRIEAFLDNKASTMFEDFSFNSIKKSLKKLVEIAKDMEDQRNPEEVSPGPEEVKELMSRTQQLRDIKNTIKEYIEKPSKRPANPKIRRTKTGNVKTVKTSKTKKTLNKAYKEYQIKLPEAQDMVTEMVARGLCDASAQGQKLQVDEIMKFNRNSFDALRRVILRHPIAQNITLRGTKEIAQERDERGRFKGSFKRHDYNKPRGA
jgi:hypothetical protein